MTNLLYVGTGDDRVLLLCVGFWGVLVVYFIVRQTFAIVNALLAPRLWEEKIMLLFLEVFKLSFFY